MARKTVSKEVSQAIPTVLRIPKRVLKHHMGTLGPLMQGWILDGQVSIPSSNLFSGPSGIGKRTMIYHMAQILFCEKGPFYRGNSQDQNSLFGMAVEDQSGALEPCGGCGSCQKALRSNWVDFEEISPEGADGKRGSIKIDQLRSFMEKLGFGAHEGQFKIIFIRDADLMTIQAANSLLKVLEEPPKGWIFFLTAADSTLLLPTIVSRCQAVRLKPLPEECLRDILVEAKVSPNRIDVASRLACGSWSKALLFANDDYWKKRETLVKFVLNPVSQIGVLVDWAAKDTRNFELLLDQLEHFIVDLLLWSSGSNRWANLDARPVLEEHAKRLTDMTSALDARSFWFSQSETINHIRAKMRAPLNRKVLVQDLLVPWLAPFGARITA